VKFWEVAVPGTRSYKLCFGSDRNAVIVIIFNHFAWLPDFMRCCIM